MLTFPSLFLHLLAGNVLNAQWVTLPHHSWFISLHDIEWEALYLRGPLDHNLHAPMFSLVDITCRKGNKSELFTH